MLKVRKRYTIYLEHPTGCQVFLPKEGIAATEREMDRFMERLADKIENEGYDLCVRPGKARQHITHEKE